MPLCLLRDTTRHFRSMPQAGSKSCPVRSIDCFLVLRSYEMANSAYHVDQHRANCIVGSDVVMARAECENAQYGQGILPVGDQYVHDVCIGLLVQVGYAACVTHGGIVINLGLWNGECCHGVPTHFLVLTGLPLRAGSPP